MEAATVLANYEIFQAITMLQEWYGFLGDTTGITVIYNNSEQNM